MFLALRRFGVLLALTANKCLRDNTPYMAASIAFYMMLSLAPGLWIIVSVAGSLASRQTVRDAALDWVFANIGPGASQFVGNIIAQANESSSVATVGGAIAIFFAATAAFSALQTSLSRIWSLPESPSESFLGLVRGFLRNFFTVRLLAFVVILLLGILLGASLVAGAVLEFVGNSMPANLPAPHLLLEVAHFGTSAILMILMFAFVYYLLHRQSFVHGEIWVGAAVTAVLFAIGNAFIGPYLGGAGLRSTYGAAGSFVLLLLWVYYSAQILLFGAAFTEIYARYRRPPNDR